MTSPKMTDASLEVAVVVRDPAAMLRFYSDFLGLPLDHEREFPGIHLWWLRCGNGFVKLVHPESTPRASNPPGGLSGATGLRYITLVVPNPEELADVAETKGCLLHRKTTEDLTMAMLEDPEGNYVEVVRWLQDSRR